MELVTVEDALGIAPVEETVKVEPEDGEEETLAVEAAAVDVTNDVAVLVLCAEVLVVVVDVEETVDVEVDVDPETEADDVVVVVPLSEEEAEVVEVSRSVEVTEESGRVVKDVSSAVDTATSVTVIGAGMLVL